MQNIIPKIFWYLKLLTQSGFRMLLPERKFSLTPEGFPVYRNIIAQRGLGSVGASCIRAVT